MDSPEFGGPRWLFALILVMLIGIALAIGLGGCGPEDEPGCPRDASGNVSCPVRTGNQPPADASR